MIMSFTKKKKTIREDPWYAKGCFAEDRSIWEKELQRHCDEVYVDVDETIEEQEKSILKYKDGERHFTEGRVTAKMTEIKVNGLKDPIASEMIQQLPQELSDDIYKMLSKSVYGGGRCLQFMEESSSAPYPQECNTWVSNVSEHTSPHVKSESQTQVQDQRCQSGPSARNSVVPGQGGFSKNYGTDQQRLQISDPHFEKIPTSATFACWKIRFKTEVCTCSQFPTEAMLWIKEVELVESVDDLKSSCSVRGIRTPDF